MCVCVPTLCSVPLGSSRYPGVRAGHQDAKKGQAGMMRSLLVLESAKTLRVPKVPFHPLDAQAAAGKHLVQISSIGRIDGKCMLTCGMFALRLNIR